MGKWIKYHFALIRLAKKNTQKGLEFLGGDYGQAIYSLLIALLVVIFNYPLTKPDNLMWGLISILKEIVLPVFIANILVFFIFLIQSKRRMFEETAINSFQDLNIKEAKIEITELNQMRTNQVVLFVTNKSSYKLKDCIVKIKEVTKINDSNFIFPRENRHLEWYGTGEGKVDIGPAANKSRSSNSIHIIDVDNDKLQFATIPSNPHLLEFGEYMICLEFSADYWWKKITRSINIGIQFDTSHYINWQMK
ncbi:MAG: hypothetical protein ACYC59_06240 [Anaerolineaceae bacterium]